MPEKGRQLLDVLMTYRREWATQCVYCGRDVVNKRLMPREYAPRSIGGLDKVEFFIKGVRHTAWACTADHYFDRCYGGRSTLNNILPSCRPCNNMRSTGHDVALCVDCRRNRRTRYKRCEPCHMAKVVKHEEHCMRERLVGALIRELRQHKGERDAQKPTVKQEHGPLPAEAGRAQEAREGEAR